MSPLSLDVPNGADFLKDFPGIHEVNSDRIDAFAGSCLPTHDIQTYTPDLTTSGGSKPVLGTGGFIRGFYYRIFDQIYTWGDFRFGTAGFSFASGVYLISLPFEANPVIPAGTLPGESACLGNASLFDNSSVAGSQPLTSQLRNSNYLYFCHRMNTGLAVREVREAGIIAWAASDGISWGARYQRNPT